MSGLVTNFAEVLPHSSLSIDTDPVYAHIARVLNGDLTLERDYTATLDPNESPRIPFAQETLETETTDRIKSTGLLRAIGADFNSSPNKLITIGGAIMAAASQAADRARVSVVLTPTAATIATEKMLPYGNYLTTPTVTLFAAATTFFLVNGLLAESLSQGIEQFPQTTRTFEEKYPKITEGFTDSLAGLDSRETRLEQRRLGLHKELTLKEKIKIHSKQATTVIGLGLAPYVATSAVNGYTLKERRTLYTAANASTSVLVGAIGFSFAETVIQLSEHGHTEQAKHVQEIASYTPLWLGIAGLSIVYEFASKRLNKWRQAKSTRLTESPTG